MPTSPLGISGKLLIVSRQQIPFGFFLQGHQGPQDNHNPLTPLTSFTLNILPQAPLPWHHGLMTTLGQPHESPGSGPRLPELCGRQYLSPALPLLPSALVPHSPTPGASHAVLGAVYGPHYQTLALPALLNPAGFCLIGEDTVHAGDILSSWIVPLDNYQKLSKMLQNTALFENA